MFCEGCMVKICFKIRYDYLCIAVVTQLDYHPIHQQHKSLRTGIVLFSEKKGFWFGFDTSMCIPQNKIR